jgi:hypothetical protein
MPYPDGYNGWNAHQQQSWMFQYMMGIFMYNHIYIATRHPPKEMVHDGPWFCSIFLSDRGSEQRPIVISPCGRQFGQAFEVRMFRSQIWSRVTRIHWREGYILAAPTEKTACWNCSFNAEFQMIPYCVNVSGYVFKHDQANKQAQYTVYRPVKQYDLWLLNSNFLGKSSMTVFHG